MGKPHSSALPSDNGGDSAWRIVSAYALFAGLWILLSDAVVGALFHDNVDTLNLVSTAKGWLFVGVTSTLLFVLISRLIGNYQRSLEILRRTESELRESGGRLQATLDALPDMLFEVGRDGHIFQYHSHRNDLLAAPPHAFLGRRFDDILPPAASAACHAAMAEAATNGFSSGQRYALELPQGTRWFDLSVVPLANSDNMATRFIVIARDITDRYNAEKQLELAGLVFQHAREGIMVADGNGALVDINAAFTRITGYERHEVIGKNPRILSSGRQGKEFYNTMWNSLRTLGFWTGEVWNRRKNGEVYAQLLTVSAVRNASQEIVQYVALFSDITALKNYQSELEHVAHFDALTGLPNRLLLADRLQQAMSLAQRRGTKVLVAYLDLDNFKHVNARFGNALGDQLLVALSKRLQEHLRDGDTLARFGGDEFVAVFTDVDQSESVQPLIRRLMDSAAQSFDLDGRTLHISTSVGVTLFPQESDLDAEQLLRQSDQAMYQAKLAGKNRHHMFDTKRDSEVRGHLDVLERMRLALKQSEFVLHYQPKVNMRTGSVIGAEALIRWQHPERGLLPPASFLPIIEEHPFSIEIGEWVLETALRQHASWQALGLQLPVSVNVGALQLQQPDFQQRLTQIVQRHPQLARNQLQLEILETSALQDMPQITALIHACTGLGVEFALDDFGTGYSSLTYLRQLPVSWLKIDQSFVRDMLDNVDDQAILRGVVDLAQSFGREAIAEGVETEAHGTLLLHLGCEVAQGYGIARPMPGAEMPAWIARWHPPAHWRSSAKADHATALFQDP